MINKNENRIRLYEPSILVYYILYYTWQKNRKYFFALEKNRRLLVRTWIIIGASAWRRRCRRCRNKHGQSVRVCRGKSSSPLNRIKPELDIIWRDEWDYACIANGQAPQHRGSGIQWYSFYDRSSSEYFKTSRVYLCVCVQCGTLFIFIFYFHNDKL